jgi:endonuclease/exonuclease/phosphatase (EEP) superfamily protein YafD
MGDLNATPAEPALAELDGAGWIDAWERTSPDERGGTWPAVAPFRRLDYVWAQLGEGWQVAECRRLPVAGSDHVGLWARLTCPSGPARETSAPGW